MYFTGSGFKCLLNVVLSAALDLVIILKSYGEIRTEYGVSLRIPSEYGKMRTKKKTPYLDTFHAVKYYLDVNQIRKNV